MLVEEAKRRGHRAIELGANPAMTGAEQELHAAWHTGLGQRLADDEGLIVRNKRIL